MVVVQDDGAAASLAALLPACNARVPLAMPLTPLQCKPGNPLTPACNASVLLACHSLGLEEVEGWVEGGWLRCFWAGYLTYFSGRS